MAIAQARSRKKQKQLLVRLLEVIAQDQVPARPGRREPRAVKRRPEPYPLVNRPPGGKCGNCLIAVETPKILSLSKRCLGLPPLFSVARVRLRLRHRDQAVEPGRLTEHRQVHVGLARARQRHRRQRHPGVNRAVAVDVVHPQVRAGRAGEGQFGGQLQVRRREDARRLGLPDAVAARRRQRVGEVQPQLRRVGEGEATSVCQAGLLN